MSQKPVQNESHVPAYVSASYNKMENSYTIDMGTSGTLTGKTYNIFERFFRAIFGTPHTYITVSKGVQDGKHQLITVWVPRKQLVEKFKACGIIASTSPKMNSKDIRQAYETFSKTIELLKGPYSNLRGISSPKVKEIILERIEKASSDKTLSLLREALEQLPRNLILQEMLKEIDASLSKVVKTVVAVFASKVGDLSVQFMKSSPALLKKSILEHLSKIPLRTIEEIATALGTLQPPSDFAQTVREELKKYTTNLKTVLPSIDGSRSLEAQVGQVRGLTDEQKIELMDRLDADGQEIGQTSRGVLLAALGPSTKSLVEEFSSWTIKEGSIELQGHHGPQNVPCKMMVATNSDEELKTKNKGRLLSIMERNRLLFKSQIDECQPEGGVIEKSIVPQGSEIFVRADLHSDLPSLLAQLKFLQNQGKLDENYRPQGNFHLVFLGDYIDRGGNDIEILSLLLTLRMNDPTKVHLLRGNHEDVETNLNYSSERKFIEANAQAFKDCYTSLPMALCMGSEEKRTTTDGKHQRTFTHFSHGLFSPAVNLSSFLKNEENTTMLIEESTRFSDLAQDATEKAKKAFTSLRSQVEALEDKICEAKSGYLWADVNNNNESGLNTGRTRLSPQTIRLYTRATAVPDAKISSLYRGHSHELSSWKVDGKHKKKCLVRTLAVGIAGGVYANQFSDESIQGELLTVNARASKWASRPVKMNSIEAESVRQGTYKLPTFSYYSFP